MNSSEISISILKKKCPHSLAVRTPLFQGGSTGSTPVGDTINGKDEKIGSDIFVNFFK